MNLGRPLWTWGIAVLFALVAAVTWLVAEQRDVDVVAEAPIEFDNAVGTPMLSARRIPETLRTPIADDSLAPVIAEIIDGSPADSCVLVQVEDRIITPWANVDVGLVPASNQKLLTTFGALGILGDDYQFVTEVRVDALPVDGVVGGNLYLVGGGDPFLSTENWWTQYEVNDGRFHTRLETLADRVVAAGITSVVGSVVGDESAYDDVRQGDWADRLIAGKQSGPLSALTVNEGFTDWPAVYADSARQRSSATDPARHAANVFGQLLAERGVAIAAGPVAGPAPATAPPVAQIASPPLSDLVTHVNAHSSNIGAELMLKQIGLTREGEGSTAAGSRALRQFLEDAGVDLTQVTIVDGSGLAETNRLTCQALASVLDLGGADTAFGASMAVGAERGTLLNRFVDTAGAGTVYAKTGTLNGATALSGYARSRVDPDISVSFAYIANDEFIISNAEVRGLQDPFASGLTAYPGGPSLEELGPREPIAN
ncbi:MAG: D-alanyl-D-alanine carboxypeptidase/D-alanyl-D-alanine-endopeptidase [Actinomycetota bacterium]